MTSGPMPPDEGFPTMFKTTIFYLDSLEVYMIQTKQEIDYNISKGVYWKDAASPQGYGPFVTVYACMEHYAWYAKGRKAQLRLASSNLNLPPTSIIRIDFQSKRVIETPDR